MQTTFLQDDFGAILTAEPGDKATDISPETLQSLLTKHGTILFQGFNTTTEEFDVITDKLGTDYMNYKGGGYVRKTTGEEDGKTMLSTSTTLEKGKIKPMTMPLPLHAEMFYTDKRPLLLWFYCVTPAEKDGQTTIGDGVAIYKRLSQKWKDLLAEKRLMYLRSYPDGIWQNIYQTDDIEVARGFCHDSGMTTEVDADNTLHTTYLTTAIPKTRWGGHTAYINSAMTVVMQEGTDREKLSSIRLEDGERLPREMIKEIVDIQSDLIIELEWQSGDFVLLDNSRTMHGRRGFEDTRRNVLLRMVRDVAF
ncbi:TauD/TfdA family dioxygenase [Flavimaricola marinus]|uniref:Taurine catabolism dioxygenase TauD, TfdA family n=1 Tax=Flavimaricola marinus TaxID=1819565 RepID=A0A238LIP2_9RHOB|nr:TauD/TfdA family dioxygenase [Flavimaricola marinus]SMY09265.1 Taurine catabolism dioxygenase TauD, TfdA family [Flavimaricola marinus]